ncbi:superfamily II DNA/RNA helicase [Streptosporangium becharense]|uniref:Superfamily II DNA/RNA helicase n=1 Tax=Streptosporangium becharense TaxID=1816182 RepID=A0A7W9ICV6_9ACTN|nr:DEAD/DEAH box helicase [Streptosporangium becharense]MBB2915245.1 superfamily II DNA/RNA helicase [Streptosporangium becharense]MBB5817926.1 superfamily II DNA/RNA helicase [Streptosporangium becharense]
MLDAVLPEITEISDARDGLSPASESLSEFTLLGLPKPLVTGLSRQGIDSPFPIQRATIPDILSGHDVLGRGQTGSGKTLAFGLPMMARVAGVKARPGRPLAVVLVPTRELAMQVTDALEPLGRGLSLRMKTVVGGMSMGRQIEALRRGVEVVVATPGRLTDLIQQGECTLDEVRVTVLDEADHMCDLGFFPVVSAILQQTPADSQRLLFSATLDGDVDKLVRRFLTDPVTHSMAPAASAVDTMEHHLLEVHRDDKFPVTAEIANREGRTIIFVRTQHGVDRLCKQLAQVGIKAGGLHGGKRQNQRTRILAEFKEGEINVLVCTDVAARGIHVDNISLVLHVDPPQDHKSYLHRGGRTARAGEKGTVMTLVLPNERRSTDAMTRRAGIKPFRLKATPGHPRLEETAGARQPSGEPIPVWEPAAPVAKQRRRRDGREGFGGGGGGRGPRRFRERPEHGGEAREPRERAFGDDTRGDRPSGGYRSDRPAGGYRGDRQGGFRGDRPSGGYRSDRPAGDRGNGAFRADQREGGYRGDREGGYRSDRPAGGYRGDRQGGFRGGEFRAEGRPDGRGQRGGGYRGHSGGHHYGR